MRFLHVVCFHVQGQGWHGCAACTVAILALPPNPLKLQSLARLSRHRTPDALSLFRNTQSQATLH